MNMFDTDRRAPRVLHIGKYYAPHWGGIETYLRSLCEELRPHLRQKVIVSNDARRTVREEIGGIPVARVAAWMTVASTPLCPGLVAEIRRSPADIIHLHLPNPPAIAAYFASGHRGRLVVGYHSDIVRQPVLGRLCEPLVRLALERAAAIIVASRGYIDSSPLLPAHESRCRVIPFGVALGNLANVDGAAVAAIREQYGPRLVVAVGRLVYYKGFDYLIEALRHVDARLVIIGKGPLLPSLIETARAAGVRDRVSFLTDVAAIAPYLHAADLFVLPSIARSEAFGIVQVEAMACGKPVINTRLRSGVPFVSIDGQTGITVPPCDSEALAHAIGLLLDHDDVRRRFGAAARRRAAEEFSVERMAARTLDLYRGVFEPEPVPVESVYTAQAERV